MAAPDCAHALQQPLTTSSHRFFALDIRVYIRPGAAEAPGCSDPTAGYVWPSASLLADFVRGMKLDSKLAGKRVLELGADAYAPHHRPTASILIVG